MIETREIIPELFEALSFDPYTGHFEWLDQSGNQRRNSPAGVVDKSLGYRMIGFKGKAYYAHRLAWLFMYGHWPRKQIDHIDMDKDNNAIDNLREASVSDQRMNKRKQSNGRHSKYKGVTWDKTRGKWMMQYVRRGKKISGRFDDELHAAAAYANLAYADQYGRVA